MPIGSKTLLRVFVMLALVLSARAAHAEKTLVIESHVGAQRQGDGRILEPALAELRARGATIEVPPSAVGRLGYGGEIEEKRIATALAAIRTGHDLWTEGHFQRAAEMLAPAIADLEASPATFARKPELRAELRRGLVALALAHHRMRAAEAATAAMAEVVRSFADQPFDRAAFGPEAHGLYQSVARNLGGLAPSKLVVTASEEAATIFINERFVGVGTVTLDALIPGRYRVYAQMGDRPGRLHMVDVATGGMAEVRIDWKLDSVLRTGPASLGLVFADGAEQASQEPTRATQVARTLGHDAVIVLRVGSDDGRRMVLGSRYSLDTAQPLRSARLLLEPTPLAPDALVALARFLLGEPPSRDLEVLAPREAVASTRPSQSGRGEEPRRRFGAWKWVMLGAGVAGIATGIYLVSIDGPIKDASGDFTAEQYDTQLPGVISIAGGAALVTTGIVLWALDRRSAPAVAATRPQRGDGLVLSLRGTF